MEVKNMEIDYISVPHPSIKDREITFIFVDDKLDLVSAKFLVHEATFGGINGLIPGRTSHKTRATRIGELYRHLNDMGLNWRNATETDIKIIRNAMLCWDANDNLNIEEYNYEPISNDAMNAKLSYWHKFYNYMGTIGEFFELNITTKKVKKKINNNKLLSHLNYREHSQSSYIDVWVLKVKPSPVKFTYHAISQAEYFHLEERLRHIDIVYVMIAYLMVETGLRSAAALEVKEKDFKYLFRYLGSGRKEEDTVSLTYIAKGGNSNKCDIPIRTIIRLQKEYLSRTYIKRKRLYTLRCNRLGKEYNENIIWLTQKGKEVTYSDLRSAFIEASERMGRVKNRITSHWMRHTFATWTLLNYSEKNNIPLNGTGISVDIRLKNLLMNKLGHATDSSTMKYVMTAIKLTNVTTHNGSVMPLKSFLESKVVQNIIREKALEEFDEEFDENLFNIVRYAIKRGVVVNDNLHKE